MFPPLSQSLFSSSVAIPPSPLSLCPPPGSRGGVSEEDAGFRARCCRRMALRIQGKAPPVLPRDYCQ